MAQNENGLSSLDISRCAGRIGVDLRSVDEAFVAFALDGLPWISTEEAQVSVGTQIVSTTITGSGWLRRRGGTVTYFRYTCLLDANRQALMAHMGAIERRVGDSSPPATTIAGTASFPKTPPLPRGIELRLQVLDTSGPMAEIVAEQVVRSGWPQPMPFALRIPKTVSLKDRKLALAARVVLAHKTIFTLANPRPLDPGDLERPIELVLEPPLAKP
ncbi:MAG: YbaY family lipoprotein [Bradyrhizobium sp.]|nr:YbaY family lipoprotein [Bradyrhizobium sp.]